MDPTKAQIAYAKLMLVYCPDIRGKLHCWNCTECQDAKDCRNWHSRKYDVELFRKSKKPYSAEITDME